MQEPNRSVKTITTNIVTLGLMKKISDRINRIYMVLAQVPNDPEQLLSASSGNEDFCSLDDKVCAFLPERHKNSGNPVNPV
jgi:hypothetical protein